MKFGNGGKKQWTDPNRPSPPNGLAILMIYRTESSINANTWFFCVWTITQESLQLMQCDWLTVGHHLFNCALAFRNAQYQWKSKHEKRLIRSHCSFHGNKYFGVGWETLVLLIWISAEMELECVYMCLWILVCVFVCFCVFCSWISESTPSIFILFSQTLLMCHVERTNNNVIQYNITTPLQRKWLTNANFGWTWLLENFHNQY